MSALQDDLQIAVDLPQLRHGWTYSSVNELGATGEQAVLTGPFGTNLGRSDFVPGGVPVLTIGCLTEGGIRLDKVLFVTEAKANELARYRLKEGDLLFSRMASVGRAGLVPKNLEGALFNYHIMRLRLDTEKIEPRVFINYVRGARQVRDYLKQVNHGATRDGINTDQLLELPVAVPPRSEQSAIVAEIEKQFSRLDEAVAGLKRVKANLKRYKAAILKAAVEGRLVPTEAELARREDRSFETGAQLLQRILDTRRSQWQGKGKYKDPTVPDTTGLPQLPDGWAWASVDQVLSSLRNGLSGKPEASEPGIPILRISAVRPLVLDIADHRYYRARASESPEDYRIRKGDLLFVRYNGTKELVGACACVGPIDLPLLYPDKLIRGRVVSESLVLAGYVAMAANVGESRRHVDDLIKTTAGQQGIAGGEIKQMPLPLPPAAEQHRIVAEVDRLLSIGREAETEVETNLKRGASLRAAILSKSFGWSSDGLD